MLLEERHAGYDAGLAACREGVELQLGADEGRGEFRVGCRAGAGAPDVGGYVVEFLAVLVGDDWARGCSCIGGDLVKERRGERKD